MPLSLRKLVQRKTPREGASVAAAEARPRAHALAPVAPRASGREQLREAGRAARRDATADASRSGFSLRGLSLGFSGAALAALALALVCAVGWSFFMGYMVGRGQNPERGVESVAGLLLPGGEDVRPADGDKAGRAGRPTADAGESPEDARGAGAPPVAEGAALSPAAESAPVGGGSEAGRAVASVGPAAPGGQTAISGPAQSVRQTGPAASATSENAGSGAGAAGAHAAYPFSRPQGDGLAAWGIAAPSGAQPGASGTGQAPAAGQVPRSAPAKGAPAAASEPQFDYLFQVAAFRGPADAERLRRRLEQAGLRSSVRPSGKVRLVLVHLRGDGGTAARLREELAAMNLGKPILLEKTPVRAARGKAARRSAS